MSKSTLGWKSSEISTFPLFLKVMERKLFKFERNESTYFKNSKNSRPRDPGSVWTFLPSKKCLGNPMQMEQTS
jgi:hypothetical protein